MDMVTGHKCGGSRYAEILTEAELITSGCLASVLSGKAYAKALFCLKTVTEAMERLLIKRFMLLLFAFRDLWKEWGDSNFQIFLQNCQFHHRRLESLGLFNVLFFISF